SAGAGAARLITYNGPEHTGNPFSGKQDIDATLIGSKWISTDLTYSFPTNANQYQAGYGSTPAGSGFDTNPSGFIAFNAAQQTAPRYALAQIQADTNLTFTEIPETTTTHATIPATSKSSIGAPVRRTAWTRFRVFRMSSSPTARLRSAICWPRSFPLDRLRSNSTLLVPTAAGSARTPTRATLRT